MIIPSQVFENPVATDILHLNGSVLGPADQRSDIRAAGFREWDAQSHIPDTDLCQRLGVALDIAY